MSFRVTTNGTMRLYKSNLMRSYKSLGDAMTKVQTHRTFNAYAEDPAAASEAFRLRRSLWRINTQLDNGKGVLNRYESAYGAVQDVLEDLGEEMGQVSALRGISDGTAGGRRALAKELQSAAEGVVKTMNVSYGKTFLFAGADGLNVPFSWDEDTGALLFRGVPVDAPPGSQDYQKLEAMAGEASYVDLGMGLAYTQVNGEDTLVTSSAFNGALSGLNFLGFGVDEDGDPKSIPSLMQRLGDIFANCHPDTGAFQPPSDEEVANRLTDKLQAALDQLSSRHTELTADATFLKTNQERLTDQGYTLVEQIDGLENADMADAITAMVWAQYSYNAALKIGNSILSQSLIDYMR